MFHCCTCNNKQTTKSENIKVQVSVCRIVSIFIVPGHLSKFGVIQCTWAVEMNVKNKDGLAMRSLEYLYLMVFIGKVIEELLHTRGSTKPMEAARASQLARLLSVLLCLKWQKELRSGPFLFAADGRFPASTCGRHESLCGESTRTPAASSRMTGLAAGQRWCVLRGLHRRTRARRRFPDCCWDTRMRLSDSVRCYGTVGPGRPWRVAKARFKISLMYVHHLEHNNA